MDVSDMVLTGIAAWVLASGPIALLIGRVLRSRSEQLPAPSGAFDVIGPRELVTAGR
jgi:hypothetical protein